jgi:hypothetical protein
VGELLSANKSEASRVERARTRLDSDWAALNTVATSLVPPKVPADIAEAISKSVNSKTLTYRYVLPTQLLAKLIEPSLDCRSVQARSGLAGAFDARTIVQEVIVPFDRNNNNVLGGSTEPYANNPLRIPAILPVARNAQKNKVGFDLLMKVLDYAEMNPAGIESLFLAMLHEVRSRLQTVSVTYPVPNRVSLKRANETLETFLSERTGGLRLQAVAVAVFKVIGSRFNMFTDVRSNNVNAPDAGTGSVADLECIDESNTTVMAVEVKDRQLRLRHLQDKLPAVRAKGVAELLFVVQGGVTETERLEVERTIDDEFASGQNLYVVEWQGFLSSCLVLFGQHGRRDFLIKVGEELDERRADISHRQRWATLLRAI